MVLFTVSVKFSDRMNYYYLIKHTQVFTGALIGYISNNALNALRTAILIPRQEGGTALYLNAMNF